MPDSNQLVSIIVPVHNRVDLFRNTIASVYEQEYRPLQLVVVNDGSSPDQTISLENILEEYRNTDQQISIVVKKTEGKGAPAARNLGYTASSGNFIQFLDSDDLLLPTKIAEQLTVLKSKPELDLVYSKAQFADENFVKINRYWGRRLKGNSMDYFEFPWQTMCPLYKRSAVEKFGLWDESLSMNQDWEFSLRYLVLGARVLFIDTIHCLFIKHTKGNIGTLQKDHKKIASKWRSTCKIYTLSKERQLLDAILKKAYLKRWAWLLMMTSSLGEKKQFREQLQEIKPQLTGNQYRLLWMLRFAPVSKMALKLYDTVN